MPIQYIYDTTGRKTGVIIPIENWTEERETTGEKRKLSGFDPGSYRGLLRGIRDQVEKELARIRAEWENR